MKDYLKDNLSKKEKGFVKAIIRNTAITFLKSYLRIQEKEVLSLDNIDDDGINAIEKKFLATYDGYSFVDKILETKILRDISALKPYTRYEKEKIIKILNNLAYEAGLEKFIAPLTFNEKLVVFLFYVVEYQLNQVSLLLDCAESTVWRNDKSIKSKFRKIKEELENE